jgi:hypothetical protein
MNSLKDTFLGGISFSILAYEVSLSFVCLFYFLPPSRLSKIPKSDFLQNWALSLCNTLTSLIQNFRQVIRSVASPWISSITAPQMCVTNLFKYACGCVGSTPTGNWFSTCTWRQALNDDAEAVKQYPGYYVDPHRTDLCERKCTECTKTVEHPIATRCQPCKEKGGDTTTRSR